MNTILRNILIVLAGTIMSIVVVFNSYAQCKNVSGTKGSLSINGGVVTVNGDGNGVATASNSIPIKICEGETITLKSTVSSPSGTIANYWLTSLASYNALTAPPSSTGSSNASYNTSSGSTNTTLTISPTLSSYSGPALYVLTQRSSENAITSHTCQVIEVIKPTVPTVVFSACNGEIAVEFKADPVNNHYDDYKIDYNPSVGVTIITQNTGLITTYPKTISSGPLTPGVPGYYVQVIGNSVTNACPVMPNNSGLITPGTAVFKPSIIGIKGGLTQDEFTISLTGATGEGRKIYMREVSNTYNYSNPFSTFNSTLSIETPTVKVPNVDKQYCFIAEAVDIGCASSTANINALSTSEACTTPVKGVAADKKNVISWAAAVSPKVGGSFTRYEIQRVNPNGTIDNFPAITTASTVSYDDADPSLLCGKSYQYIVKTFYNDPMTSASNIVSVTASSTTAPAKIPLVFSSITNAGTGIKVQGQFLNSITPLDLDPLVGYKFYRAEKLNSTYALVKNAITNSIEDIDVQVQQKAYCYYMTWTNTCGKESEPSNKVCSVFLTNLGSSVKWSAETPFSIGTDSYIIQQVNNTTGFNIKSFATTSDATTLKYDMSQLDESEGQEIYVQIEARPIGWTISGSSLPSALSNVIRYYRPALILSPQIFTPNGDGTNDRFLVRGKFIKNLKMTIFDRWGNTIYFEENQAYPSTSNFILTPSLESSIGWDGAMASGLRAPEGSYAFRIEVEDTIGQKTTKEGALMLSY